MSLFFLQMRNELHKLFARKRTYLGFAAFVAVEILLLLLLNLPKPKAGFRKLIEQNGYGFDQYFSGATLGLLMLMWTTFLLGALYLALVAGDVVAKEVEDGTLRMILCRPISRLRVGFLKYAACVLYTFALTFFIGLTALVAGLLYCGWGGLFAIAPLEQLLAMHEAWPGFWRYLGALPLLGFGLVSISSLGFLFSCCEMKPAAATILTLSIFFFDSIFRSIPYFESLRGWFMTSHMTVWLRVFEYHIPWWRIAEDVTWLGALNVTFALVGLAILQKRDFKA
ncbi:MAG: ABC transporter permease [Verrucomicrobia bacterium]|jgi:ABC-2 type transport system permease protein|nr:ABC transporter permease [Verrucomicrobiota bacterium]MDA0858631.1 ABC transporter permease [Verrucomicrobiota bacterium]